MIEDKVDELIRCDALPDDQIPHCNAHERWQKPNIWAVRKTVNKTAMRGGIKYSEYDAKNMVKDEIEKLAQVDINKGEIPEFARAKHKDKFTIDIRRGEEVRCNSYCSVNKFCHYYRMLSNSTKD